MKFFKIEENEHPYVTKGEGQAKVVRDGKKVHVYITSIRSHFNPDNIEGVKVGDAVLIHAAAGGMGLILSQWAHSLGALVIGTVGSKQKIDLALKNGCDYVINYRGDDFVSRVLEITSGKGVDVVYDAIGKDVFLDSLKCVKTLGFVISYGTASGDVEAFDLQLLHQKSIIVARPTLRSFISAPGDLQRGAAAFFKAIQNKVIDPTVRQLYPFENVRMAHKDLEEGLTTGSVGLVSGV